MHVARRRCAEVGNGIADDHAGDDCFSDRIAAEAVEAVQIPASGLAAGKKAVQPAGAAVGVGADAAHRVMLGRTHGNPLSCRIDAKEVLADFLDLTQLAVDMGFAEQGDVEPEMFTKTVSRTLAATDVGFHAAGDDVTRGEFLFLRFVVRHEAVAIDVAQQAAVAAAAFGDQDAGRKNRGRVKLHGFHVGERYDTGFERDGGTDALVDHGIGRRLVDAPETAGGDAGGARNVGRQLAVGQVADDGAVAALAVMDQRDGFHAFVHRNAGGNGLVADSVEHGVAGAVGNVTGAPFFCAAEIAGGNQALGGLRLVQGDALAVDDHIVRTGLNTVPGNAPGRQFADGLRSGMDEHAGDLLVGSPVAAAYGVFEMNVFVVAGTLCGVAQTGLHAALGRCRVRALGRHQTENDDFLTPLAGGKCGAQPGQPAADDEDVGVDDFHFSAFRWLAVRSGGLGRNVRRHARHDCDRFPCRPPA